MKTGFSLPGPRAVLSWIYREIAGLDRSPGDSYYGDTASRYLENRPDWEAEQVAFESLIRNQGESQRVLDLPVGPGRFFDVCLDLQDSLWGVDLSEEMLSIARERAGGGLAEEGGGITLLEASAESLPFPDGFFDVTVSARFLDGNITFSQLRRVLREIRRVTDKTALLHLTYRTKHGSLPLHPNRVIAGRLTDEDLRSFLREHGFEVKEKLVTAIRETSEAIIYRCDVR